MLINGEVPITKYPSGQFFLLKKISFILDSNWTFGFNFKIHLKTNCPTFPKNWFEPNSVKTETKKDFWQQSHNMWASKYVGYKATS